MQVFNINVWCKKLFASAYGGTPIKRHVPMTIFNRLKNKTNLYTYSQLLKIFNFALLLSSPGIWRHWGQFAVQIREKDDVRWSRKVPLTLNGREIRLSNWLRCIIVTRWYPDNIIGVTWWKSLRNEGNRHGNDRGQSGGMAGVSKERRRREEKKVQKEPEEKWPTEE